VCNVFLQKKNVVCGTLYFFNGNWNSARRPVIFPFIFKHIFMEKKNTKKTIKKIIAVFSLWNLKTKVLVFKPEGQWLGSMGSFLAPVLFVEIWSWRKRKFEEFDCLIAFYQILPNNIFAISCPCFLCLKFYQTSFFILDKVLVNAIYDMG